MACLSCRPRLERVSSARLGCPFQVAERPNPRVDIKKELRPVLVRRDSAEHGQALRLIFQPRCGQSGQVARQHEVVSVGGETRERRIETFRVGQVAGYVRNQQL